MLLAYGSFGWFLSHQAGSTLGWGIAITFTIAQALLLTTAGDRSQLALNAWLRSDLGYFSLVIVSAMLVAFAFIWARIFGYILVVVATELLARLDLQTIGFNRIQSLIILILVSASGLATGWVVSQYVPPWF